MRKFTKYILILLMFSFLDLNTIHARASRPSDGVRSGRSSVDFNAASSSDENPGYRRRNGRCPSSQESLWLARAASKGAGLIPNAGAICYVGVKRIIADAFNKNLPCMRKFIYGEGAKDAGVALQGAGFINVKNSDPDACFCPGTIRVYTGRSVSGINDSAGTKYGDIQVVGEEGCFHHFASSCTPTDKRLTNAQGQSARPLIGCWIMPEGRSQSSNFAQCPNSSTGRADGDSGGGDGRPYRGSGER